MQKLQTFAISFPAKFHEVIVKIVWRNGNFKVVLIAKFIFIMISK